MANEYFRRCSQTNADVLGTGRYHDGIKAIPIGTGIRTFGGWDGLNSPNFSYNDQHSSDDFFATVTANSNAPWNVRHSYGLDFDSAGDGWLLGSDKQPAATANDRKELWKINGSTGSWGTVINSNVTGMSDRVLFGFAINKDTNEKFVFGGQVGYTYSLGNYQDILKISADGLTVTTVQTGLTYLAGNNDGQVCWDPVRKVFHLVCTGGHYDNTAGARTFTRTHYTYDPATNTLTQLGDFPGIGRWYANLIWDYTDNVLLFVNGAVDNSGGATLNVAEIWYWNGYDWAKKVAKPATSHATALCWKSDKVNIIMGNENPTAWVYEKYERLLL